MITPPYEDNPANGLIYPSYVPKTDSDGNDIAGIRLPELTVPLATYTGWGLRSGEWANDGCEASGQYIPFKARPPNACRGRSASLRPGALSLVCDVLQRVMRAIDNLVRGRFMLCDDAGNVSARLLQAGLAAGVPPPQGNSSPQETVPACLGHRG